jgi:hypothetical protein
MTSYIHLSGKKIEVEEKEEPVLLEIEKPKVVVVKDELDISVEEEKKEDETPNEAEQEEEGAPKNNFKPEGFSWTNCDGNPRNHVQVISKFTKYPIEECNTTIRNLESSLMEILFNDIKTKEGKIHLINY